MPSAEEPSAEEPSADGPGAVRGRHAADPSELPPRRAWKVVCGVLLLAAGVATAFFAVGLIFTADDLHRKVTTGTSFPFATVGSVLATFGVLGFTSVTIGWRLVVRR